MDVGAGRTPDQPRLMQARIDIAECRRSELIRVPRELALEKVISGRSSCSPRCELFGHGFHPCSHGSQRIPSSGVDVGTQHATKLRHHDITGLRHHRSDVLVDHGDTTGSGRRRQRTTDPSRQGSVDTVGQGSGEIGQLGLVVNQRRFGLRVHPLRLR